MSQADAALAAARLNVEQLRAAYSQAMAQERVAAGEVDLSQVAVRPRRRPRQEGHQRAVVARRGAARSRQGAEEQHSAALQGIDSARAALGGDPDIATDKHPTVLAALAARDKAAFDLAQTTVRAPADGMISQASSFKVGQFVAAGTPLFSAGRDRRHLGRGEFQGNPAHQHEARPDRRDRARHLSRPSTFHATVESIGAGTGAEFSLLPAQNATGNWVKVTQRIPVRLKLDDRRRTMCRCAPA